MSVEISRGDLQQFPGVPKYNSAFKVQSRCLVKNVAYIISALNDVTAGYVKDFPQCLLSRVSKRYIKFIEAKRANHI